VTTQHLSDWQALVRSCRAGNQAVVAVLVDDLEPLINDYGALLLWKAETKKRAAKRRRDAAHRKRSRQSQGDVRRPSSSVADEDRDD
jgi:hypothetical protein